MDARRTITNKRKNDSQVIADGMIIGSKNTSVFVAIFSDRCWGCNGYLEGTFQIIECLIVYLGICIATQLGGYTRSLTNGVYE